MSEYADIFPKLFALAALLLVALAATPVARRAGLPGPAAFLAVGVFAGALGLVPTDVSVVTLEQIGAVALYAILFQGGVDTGFRAWRRSARPIVLLGLPGTAATAAALALAGRFVLGLDWSLAAVVGIALAPTDPAAVYAVLRGQRAETRARTVLEGESGFNDPIGISLMVVAVAMIGPEGATVADGALRLVEELAIGLAGGIAGGLLLTAALRATPRLEEGLQSVAVLVGALLVGAGTASIHGSGFLAVYVAGLLVSDAWAKQDGRDHAVPAAAAALAEPLLFALLGAVFAPLVGWSSLAQGLVLALLTAFAVRPLVAAACTAGSGLRGSERILVSWGGLKGAVPLLLAAYPALEALDSADETQAIVLVATAASVVAQGATLSLVAARVARGEPRRGSPGPAAA